ncbi:MAG: dihydrolipoamide acetyltransferase family protein [Anaerolineae bacterium]
MAVEVAMPKLGLLMTEAVVVDWLVADGETVREGQPIVDIMTEKITYQVVAPSGGILRQAAPLDAVVRIGERLALIVAPDEALPAMPPKKQRTGRAATSGQLATAGRPGRADRANGFVLSSPWARHLAEQLGIDLAQVQGTGPEGWVIARDVLNFRGARSRRRARRETDGRERAGASGQPKTIPFSGMRKVIAQRMTESLHTMAQATLTAEVDVTDLVHLRKEVGGRPIPTHTDLVVKAVATALRQHPHLNAVLLGDEIELLDDINIGIAVPLTEGVLVAVVRDADRLTATQIARKTRRLAKAAQAGTLTVDEVVGSTFTVTDLGVYGVDFFVPIINPPEAAILGVGRINEKPVILRGKVAPRHMMMLCLSFDHRVVDGAPAAAFLHSVSKLLEKPQSLFASGG